MASTDHTEGFRDRALDLLNAEERSTLDQKRYFLQQRSGKDSPPEEDDVGEHDWTITYVDMVTLMMAFFVFLTAMSFVEPTPGNPKGNANDSVQQVSVFEGKGFTPATEGQPANRDDVVSRFDDPEENNSDSDPSPSGEQNTGKAPGTTPPAPGPTDANAAVVPDKQAQPPGGQLHEPGPMNLTPPTAPGKLVTQLQQLVADDNLAGQVEVISNAQSVTLRISEKILFSSGRAGLEVGGRDLVSRLSKILEQSGGMISIEGHTDNIPIRNSQFASNWELSAARATEVVRQLASMGLPAGRLRAIAYGETRPVASNQSVEGRSSNRRVELVITNDEKAQ